MKTRTKQPTETSQHIQQDEKYPYGVFKLGDRIHIKFYSDLSPATVIDIKRNGKEVHVREDQYKLAAGQKPEFIPGGFAAHCTNQRELQYDITENPDGTVWVYTLRQWRGRGVWTMKGNVPDGKQGIAHGWRAFYDYNF